jgi:hypothetical protein
VNYLVQEESELDLSEVQPKPTEKTRKFESFLVYLVQEESELDLSEVQPKHIEKTGKSRKVVFSELSCSRRNLSWT